MIIMISDGFDLWIAVMVWSGRDSVFVCCISKLKMKEKKNSLYEKWNIAEGKKEKELL